MTKHPLFNALFVQVWCIFNGNLSDAQYPPDTDEPLWKGRVVALFATASRNKIRERSGPGRKSEHWIRLGTPESYTTDSMTGLTWSAIMIKRAFSSATQVMKKEVVMFPVIDKEKTGRQIRALMTMRGLSVQDVRAFLSLGCVQSVYHWLDGQSLPTLDNLYGLSELLQVPLDMLVVGDRRYHPKNNVDPGTERLLRYYTLLQECMAA